MDAAHEVIVRKLKEHSRLDEDDIGELQTLSTHARAVGPNEDFVRQGDKPNVSAVVLRGMVARYHAMSGGKRQYLSFHFAGDLPDAQSLFIEKMDHAVCGIGAATVALIPHQEILDLFERRPSLGISIWRETLIDAAIFREAITNNGSRPMLTRMAHLFCELFYRSRAAGLVRGETCDLPINQGQIGEALGMSIVTVNRTLQELRGTHAMDFRHGKLTVHHWGQLGELGDFNPSYLHLKRPLRI